MSFEQDTSGRPFIAASAINKGAVVGLIGSINNTVIALASAAHAYPLGIALATAASPGQPVAVQDEGIAKVFLPTGAGSVVAGQFVAAATMQGVQTFVPSMASGGPPRYGVGVALQNAIVGDIFAIYIETVVAF